MKAASATRAEIIQEAVAASRGMEYKRAQALLYEASEHVSPGEKALDVERAVIPYLISNFYRMGKLTEARLGAARRRELAQHSRDRAEAALQTAIVWANSTCPEGRKIALRQAKTALRVLKERPFVIAGLETAANVALNDPDVSNFEASQWIGRLEQIPPKTCREKANRYRLLGLASVRFHRHREAAAFFKLSEEFYGRLGMTAHQSLALIELANAAAVTQDYATAARAAGTGFTLLASKPPEHLTEPLRQFVLAVSEHAWHKLQGCRHQLLRGL